MTPREVEIPERLADLPRRGPFPVPPVFGVDGDGVPDFTVLDSDAWTALTLNERCHLCGKPLEETMFFIGGPVSTVNRCYQDGPMHKECALYALRVCPFLAQGKSYTDRPARVPGRGDAMQANPGKFALLRASGYEILRVQGTIVFFASTEAEPIESWWANGEEIPEEVVY